VAKTERVGGAIQRWLYLYDGWDIAAVLNEAGQLRETFTRGVGLAGDIGTLVAVTHHAGSSTNGVFYAQHNHRGDTTLSRAGTATVGRYEYWAFGNLKSATGPDVCRFKFSSKERDAATGLSYYGYRFYAPQWQRWFNRDPIGDIGNTTHSQILLVVPRTTYLREFYKTNPYLFGGNNPLNGIDIWGNVWYKPWTWPWIDWGEAFWEALKAATPGSWLTAPVECGPDAIRIWQHQREKDRFIYDDDDEVPVPGSGVR